MPLIDRLTPEQEALIPIYQEKWRKILLSTQPIDREKAAAAVKAAYASIEKKEPEILFWNSPYAALSHTNLELNKNLPVNLGIHLIFNCLHISLKDRFYEKSWERIGYYRMQRPLEQLLIEICHIWGALKDKVIDVEKYDDTFVQHEVLAFYGSWFDFCISVLEIKECRQEWEVYQLLVEECGWILPWEKGCFVCDRPRILSFDNQQRLHAEGSPAIQFADGFSVYAYHGVRLPEEYGKLHPSQWRSEWLLTEENAELRRVLIQGIGYARICQELQAIEIDSWREYSLLKIDNDIDVEPIYMLKMSCPSTGYIHALRVPPEMQTAREAIKWVNWGIDPEEFSMQT